MVLGFSLVFFLYFYEGVVIWYNSMLGNGSYMESLLLFCRNMIKKSIRKICIVIFSC